MNKTLLIYAKAHDQTVAEDYFAAMERVEERMEIAPPRKEEKDEVVNMQMVFQLIGQLETPELCFEERIDIAIQLRDILDRVNEHAPPNWRQTF